LQVTLCDPYMSALSVRYGTSIKALYKSASFTPAQVDRIPALPNFAFSEVDAALRLPTFSTRRRRRRPIFSLFTPSLPLLHTLGRKGRKGGEGRAPTTSVSPPTGAHAHARALVDRRILRCRSNDAPPSAGVPKRTPPPSSQPSTATLQRCRRRLAHPRPSDDTLRYLEAR